MSGIFNLESPVVRSVTRVGDLAVLSLMWFVGCIPVVTIGASNTAMCSAILGFIVHVTGQCVQAGAGQTDVVIQDNLDITILGNIVRNLHPSCLIQLNPQGHLGKVGHGRNGVGSISIHSC